MRTSAGASTGKGGPSKRFLAAYRLGARVSWRRVADAATGAGATAPELAALAEAIFAYIDELSSISAEGYSAERAESVSERQRQREELVRMLIEGASPDAVAALADEVGWALPASAAALVAPDAVPGALATRLGHGVIAAGLERRVGVRDRAGPRLARPQLDPCRGDRRGPGGDRSRGPARRAQPELRPGAARA